MKSDATTVEAYLDELPEERRAVVAAVRQVIVDHLPEGYSEAMNWGMISYEVPLERYPDTYNKQPLMYAALAAQKNHYGLYLMCVYQDSDRERQLREAFVAAGKKLDMGKSCVRFKKLEDLPLEAVGEVIADVTPEQFIESYETARAGGGKGRC